MKQIRRLSIIAFLALTLAAFPQVAFADETDGADSQPSGNSQAAIVDDAQGISGTDIGDASSPDPNQPMQDGGNSGEGGVPNSGDLATEPESGVGGDGETDGDSDANASAGISEGEGTAGLGFAGVPEDAIIYRVQRASAPSATLTMSGKVQGRAWSNASSGIVGITGKSLRLEGLRLKVNSEAAGSIVYQAHVQKLGWQAVVKDGGVAGDPGKGLRIEAVRIALTGELSQWYNVKYQAHVQKKGWMGWTSNGSVAGTTGQGLRIEALEVVLEPKSAESAESKGIVTVRYKTHCQKVGWSAWVADSAMSGTTGRRLRMEALQVSLTPGTYGGGIEYRAHVQKFGWQKWVSNGAQAGTTGRSLRMEAVALRLTGAIKNTYDIVYRAHVQKLGWQPWTVNGGTAGTTGRALRIEAIQIKLVRKGTAQSVSNGTYYITTATNPNSAMYEAGGSGAQGKTATYSLTTTNERFFLRNEGGGKVSLQSVATGMFLTQSGSKVVQFSWSSGNQAQLWKVGAWNGGIQLTNALTGSTLSRSGSLLVAGGGERWVFTGTNLIINNTYNIINSSAGKVLDVASASWAPGANIQLYNSNNGGNQAFTITRMSGETYKIINAMNGRAVEVAGGSKSNGANVRQAKWNGGNAQQWIASLDRSGKLQFTNKASGKVLSAAGSGGAKSNVNSTANSQARTQLWSLKPSSYKQKAAVVRAYNMAENMRSGTNYLLMVDLTNHWVTILQGSSGRWNVIRNTIMGCGAPETPTPQGDFTVGSKGYSFSGGNYTCYYYTQIIGNYLFHTGLYYRGTWEPLDLVMGGSWSHGCVRLPTDQAKWIWDYIPGGTRIHIYS